ncbi:MAG: methylenetetrahydrofolate reductase [NAD(P)H], partial [Gammaproteobacteria bacterium]|nr:methylenetetrahydrofolate reductase [NAD(P)H] [Gammaproteobacteria bacterium]
MNMPEQTRPAFSFEFFPPRTPEAVGKLEMTRDSLAKLNPDFFSVTFGAGGSTRERTLETVVN